ncbi:hexokinase, partial [Tremellales sp. Uapishka_1]
MGLPEILSTFEPSFLLKDEKLKDIVKHFRGEMEGGLAAYGKDVAMVPSFVTGVPDGSEEGTFLALDLGGTNLRVCEVTLFGENKFEIKQQKYKVSEELKNGQARVLFDYIADSVDGFLTDIGSNIGTNEPMHLGFTFSFPVEQTAIDAGKLLTWTKGFAAKNAIGHDVVRLLQDAFDRKHIHVRCSALVNDTVGTLLSRSYQNGPALIGAIFGTGTNGAYIDKTRTISKLGEETIAAAEAGGRHAGEYMVVNTEWGAFDNERHCLPISMFDNKLDRESINPRKQAFEKLVSGMYLGEITRNIILHLIDLSILFSGYSSPIINTHYGYDTAFVSHVEGAKDDAEVKRIVISDLGMAKEHVTDEDLAIVRWVCSMVAKRAAALAACAIAAVVLHTGSDKNPEGTDVGVDGSVAEFLPHFSERVTETLVSILGKEMASKIKIGLARDGSGVGVLLNSVQNSGFCPDSSSLVDFHPTSGRATMYYPTPPYPYSPPSYDLGDNPVYMERTTRSSGHARLPTPPSDKSYRNKPLPPLPTNCRPLPALPQIKPSVHRPLPPPPMPKLLLPAFGSADEAESAAIAFKRSISLPNLYSVKCFPTIIRRARSLVNARATIRHEYVVGRLESPERMWFEEAVPDHREESATVVEMDSRGREIVVAPAEAEEQATPESSMSLYTTARSSWDVSATSLQYAGPAIPAYPITGSSWNVWPPSPENEEPEVSPPSGVSAYTTARSSWDVPASSLHDEGAEATPTSAMSVYDTAQSSGDVPSPSLRNLDPEITNALYQSIESMLDTDLSESPVLSPERPEVDRPNTGRRLAILAPLFATDDTPEEMTLVEFLIRNRLSLVHREVLTVVDGQC